MSELTYVYMPDSTQQEQMESIQSPDLEKYTLSEEQRKNLTSGVSIAEDDPSADLAELEERLAQTRDATDEKRAWITAIIPPWIESNDEEEIAVQFLVNSEYSFWKTYDYPEDYFPEDHPFRRLINSTGYNIDTLEKALGEQIPLQWNNKQNEWEPDIKTEKEKELEKAIIETKGLRRTGDVTPPTRVYIGVALSFLLVILYISAGQIIPPSLLASNILILSAAIYLLLVVATVIGLSIRED